MMKFTFVKLLLSLLIHFTIQAQHTGNHSGKKLNTAAIDKILGIKGTEKDGEYKITVPQNDLQIMVDGFQIIPPMGLGSWAAFMPVAEGAMLMGDIVVKGEEIGPIQKVIINNGLTVTGLHNHFVRDNPKVMYMHISGIGSEEKLAQGVKAIFNKITELRKTDPSKGAAKDVTNTLNTQQITSLLGQSGEMSRGVYKVTIGRPDVKLQEHGAPVSSFMGFNTWAAWQGTPEKAAVAGDFAMLENEVEHVIEALVNNGIEVVALHNHMVHEEPRIFFLHYWGVGPAEKLANGLKAALAQTSKK
jgi:hypothetical protein